MLRLISRRALLGLFILTFLLTTPLLVQAQTEEPDEELQQQQISPEDAQDRMDMIRAVRENVSLFGEIYRQVNMRYVDQVEPEEFMKAGIKGMLATLDPYTDYMEMENSDDLRILSEGEYGGVGLQIGTRGTNRVLTVISPIEGTPAWRLGIRAGDQILYIEEESTEGWSTSDAASKLRGKAGTKVKVKVNRYGVDDLLEYTITRERIEVKDVSYAGYISDGVGYVRLTRFSRSAGEEVKLAIEDLQAQQELKGLVLDLRSNPGGLLPEAISVAENFLQPGEEIVSTRGRLERTNNVYYAQTSPSLSDDIPLVVLINGGSASASEIVSGAVQDLDRGLIIGRTSFGKGLVQNVINFKDGTALRVTTAKYYTPSGRLIQKADYFNDNDAIIPSELDIIADTLFHTAGGREVVAHGGIVPDVVVEGDEVGELTLALWRQDLFFDFVSKFMDQNPDQHTWKDMGPVLHEQFLTYMDTTDFEFETELQGRIAELHESLTTVSDSTIFLESIGELESLAQAENASLFERERDELENRLVVELAAALDGSAGRTQASLNIDPDIVKAIEVLSDEDLYASLLAGTYAAVDTGTEEDQ
ncbi:S41 family peptidase [bacterium]|nr:S41 family peptidase [bacterium]